MPKYKLFTTKENYQLVIDQETGVVWVPGYNALGRICAIGTDQKAVHAEKIKRAVASVLAANSDLSLESALIATTAQGQREVTLIPEKIANSVIRTFNTALADKIYEAGGRVFYYGIVGYKGIGYQEPQPKLAAADNQLTVPEGNPFAGSSQAQLLLHAAQCLVNLEKEQAVIKQTQSAQAKELAELKAFRREIEENKKEILSELNQLPPAKSEAEEVTTRFYLNRLIRGYCETRQQSYQLVWKTLHAEFRDRYHIDLRIRGKNHKPKLSGPEYAERYNHIDELYAVALEIFG